MPKIGNFHSLLLHQDAEQGHNLALRALRVSSSSSAILRIQNAMWGKKVPSLPIEVFGKKFKNPVGLAAGFDKDGIAVPAIEAMGFGFIEIGTVTPLPQPGNQGKRIFRIDADEAIVNRLGFNNAGLKKLCQLMQNKKALNKQAVLGVNIGKNTATKPDNVIQDYLAGLEGVYSFADYVALNVSSPNTPGLRDMQNESELDKLLRAVMNKRSQLSKSVGGKKMPIVLKISPDLSESQLESIATNCLRYEVDAIIATNSTVTRPAQSREPLYKESGGLSGKPLNKLSTETIRKIAEATNGLIPIIGCGGISNADDAWEKMVAGATLVQLYSTLVFQGPTIVGEIVRGIQQRVYDSSANNLANAQAVVREVG